MADDLKAKAQQVYDLLVERYGAQPLKPRRQPMHELISTILSHRTTQRNEALAYDRMWERFGSWEAIRDAPMKDLVEAIAPSNFAEVKAPYIQGTLSRIIAERGEANIDFLADLPAEQGLEWLMSMPGVGIKTASLVLLFCFSKPVLPVDTHVYRVSQRVGLIGAKVSANAAHQAAAEAVSARSLRAVQLSHRRAQAWAAVVHLGQPALSAVPAQNFVQLVSGKPREGV